MQTTGIELILRENVADRLGKILPILERMDKSFKNMNKTLSTLESSQKRVDSNFKNIGRSVDMVSAKERGLRNINTGMQGIGAAAAKSTSMVGALGRSLMTVVGTMAPLLAAMKGLQLLTAGVGEGLDFQSKVIGLGRTGIPTSERDELVKQSLQLGASGKYVLSGGQFVEAARGALPVLGSGRVAEALPEFGRFTTAARQSNVKFDNPEMLARFWELYGRRKPKEREEFDTALLKTLQFSNIDPGQLLYQSNIAGGALLGQNPITAMEQLAYFIKESGSGVSGGGGGGRGRAGFAMQSLDRVISQGKVPVATLEMWHQLGWLPGIEKYMKPSSRGHTYLMEDATGQHTIHGTTGSTMAGASHVTNAAAKEYFLKENPPWLAQAGTDESLFAKQMVLGAAQIAGIKGSPEQMITGFGKLPDAQQKHLLAAISGGTMLSNTAVIQMAAGRYKTSFDIMKSGIDKAPGFTGMESGQTSIAQKWEQFTAQFETFADKFINTPEILGALNTTMDGLIDALKALNNNVSPIVSWLTGHSTFEQSAGALLTGKDRPSAMSSGFNNLSNAIWHGGSKGPNVGRMLWKNLQGGSSAIVNNIVATAQRMGKDPVTALATAMHESGLNPFAVGDHGTSFGLFQLHKGGELGKMSPGQAFDPITNIATALSHFGSGTGGAMAAHAQRPANPAAYAKAVDALMPKAREIIIHNDIHLDGKKIAEHTSHHVEKKQMKAAQRMSLAASGAGGSHTPSSYNAGGNQD